MSFFDIMQYYQRWKDCIKVSVFKRGMERVKASLSINERHFRILIFYFTMWYLSIFMEILWDWSNESVAPKEDLVMIWCYIIEIALDMESEALGMRLCMTSGKLFELSGKSVSLIVQERDIITLSYGVVWIIKWVCVDEQQNVVRT